ncbi:fungal-specific transcription factor domain-containing protein [Xylaria palmicola]|nr:fungal-specific transcription factor domain-containing protein [Xylaria palmicola]
MPSKPRKISRQGCWTCKSRKVQCDQSIPTCQRCAKAQRACEGYGLRLSWPREGDKRRAIGVVLPLTGTRMEAGQADRHWFINTTSQDVQMYHGLSIRGARRPPDHSPPIPKLWSQPQSDVTNMELVYYFRDAAHHALATFSPHTANIRDVIMRMLFVDDTVSKRALFHALLAFSSLRRSGLHRETMLFKVAALGALSASAKEASHGLMAAAQHIAACMILCSFEILLPSENSGEWLFYLQGAMEVVQRAQLGNQTGRSDDSSLLDWVCYHDLMSRFTLYHWRHKYLARAAPGTVTSPVPQSTIQHLHLVEERTEGLRKHFFPIRTEWERRAPLSQSPPHAVFNVLSEICEVLLDPSDPRSHGIEYRERLRALEWKIDSLPSSSSARTPEPGDPGEDLRFTVRLYQTATRIYLARASRSPSAPAADLDALVAEVYAGPVQDCYCRHFFPLLIIACEARTDDQRAAILNLIDRTERKGYVRSMAAFGAQVRSFWVQRDLYADGDLVLDYLAVMKDVISANHALPSFV